MKRFHEKYNKGPGCWEWQAYLYSTGQWTHRQLSKQFGVSHQQISNIMKHKNWSKV